METGNSTLSKLTSLVTVATSLLGPLTLSDADSSAATVAAAILSRSGRTYTGVCLHLNCGIGFCAEHAAVAEMIKARETEIEMVVAVGAAGIMAPCGRCRELFAQVSMANFSCLIGLPDGRLATLKDLLPEYWMTVSS